TNPSVLIDKTQSARDGLGTVQPKPNTKKGPLMSCLGWTLTRINKSLLVMMMKKAGRFFRAGQKYSSKSSISQVNIDSRTDQPSSSSSLSKVQVRNVQLCCSEAHCAETPYLPYFTTSLILIPIHNFSASLPTELKELPFKVNE
ncbi:hypothetical protein Tco_0784431, partial [Tanacetum coccineum]